MHVLITGAAGMLGRKLTNALVREGVAAGTPVTRLTLADVVPPPKPAGFEGDVVLRHGNIADPAIVAHWLQNRPDLVFHLAAIVSGEAEADLDKGYAVNLDGTRHLLDAVRALGQGAPYRPRFVMTSSIAVFGPPFLPIIPDEWAPVPHTSYGAQKAMGEFLLNDWTRRGFIDGIALRLPTVCIRPGKPNAAASGFFSSILREPLAGQEAVLPVSDAVRHWHVSPARAVGFLLHAARIDLGPLGVSRALNMPGISATVGDQLDALRAVAGENALRLIRRVPDPRIQAIVASWPENFEAKRARALGFVPDASFAEIIAQHLEAEAQG